MTALLTILPWALTVIFLLFIVFKKGETKEELFEEDDFLEEEVDSIRVAVYNDKAYWVHKNIFYESEVIREPDFTTARPIDTMSMSQKDLKKLLSILDDLEESEKD